ncbi:MAG: copper resistance system multicopper oxidase [Pseudomonadales bacterium]
MSATRRHFLQQTVATGALAALLPAWARSGVDNDLAGIAVPGGTAFDLHVRDSTVTVDGKKGNAVLVNEQLPAPLLRWQEGDTVTLNVTNHLQEDTSIHWHGLLLPYQMDGVPGLSFPGIAPGATFTYQFPVLQAGTYWYHSHSGLQEQIGHYGPIVIEPSGVDPVGSDREYVVLLSDWTFERPQRLFRKLKKHSDIYNRQQQTAVDFIRDARSRGLRAASRERRMWGRMRMNQTDIADVTAATYTYLLNGHSNTAPWLGLFAAGERVRLRCINASAMSIFNLRIPDLPLTVVQADGLNTKPVTVDELQIGTAETFDVIVEPKQRPYTLVAESNDRSGMVHGTLSPTAEQRAAVPPLRKRPLLQMKDMAMDHGAAGHSDHAHHRSTKIQSHHHAQGPGVVGLAMQPSNRLHEAPLGLTDVAHRVLNYGDLRSLEHNPDTRAPERDLELHLTSNMERYMWSFDGVRFSDVSGPIVFRQGERLRLIMVNDTMMPHPIHLHGMYFEVENGSHHHKPRKHTVVVKPGERMGVLISAEAPGDWAFHCHLLYHMLSGMMRVVSITPDGSVDSKGPHHG